MIFLYFEIFVSIATTFSLSVSFSINKYEAIKLVALAEAGWTVDNTTCSQWVGRVASIIHLSWYFYLYLFIVATCTLHLILTLICFTLIILYVNVIFGHLNLVHFFCKSLVNFSAVSLTETKGVLDNLYPLPHLCWEFYWDWFDSLDNFERRLLQ